MRSGIWIVDVISLSGAKGHFSQADFQYLISSWRDSYSVTCRAKNYNDINVLNRANHDSNRA
jgi:hypothetical protein